MVKCLVVLQPPERRPKEGNEGGLRVPQSLNFANRGGVIGRRPKVLAVSLKEWDRAIIAAELIGSDVLVDNNKLVFRRDQSFKFLLTEPKPMVPQFRCGDGLPNDNGGHSVREFR